MCFDKGSSYDLETLYWLTKDNNNFNAVDFVQMFHYVYDNFDLLDFIVLRIPVTIELTSIPEKEKFLEMLREALIYSDYYSR